jgi:dTDP-4-dehydrorhamnose 3,5-epimerase
MNFEYTPIDGLLILNPDVFTDERGYFYEMYNKNILSQAGIQQEFIQDNVSQSQYGTIRGLHLQLGRHAQAKLVQVLFGEVLDVALDLRPGSKTYGKYFSIILNDENKKQLYIPRGFAHGFAVLSDIAKLHYKCDNFYHKQAETGIIYNDSQLKIDWQIPKGKIIVSEKDRNLGKFDDYNNR